MIPLRASAKPIPIAPVEDSSDEELGDIPFSTAKDGTPDDTPATPDMKEDDKEDVKEENGDDSSEEDEGV